MAKLSGKISCHSSHCFVLTAVLLLAATMTDVLQIFDLASCVLEQYLWMHFNKMELYVLSLPSSL